MATASTRRLSDSELIEALEGLNATLDHFATNTLTCSAATRHRVEGAAVALRAVVSGVVPTLAALGTE